ncbi:hypothetical protein TUMEXPCC7403_25220 [Tumidithrix helvetica PCC 7403]|uniref:hypothetical protein n=1 Tax=Tumidithrix helvetica TaxID=3457545 RepID=UPI003CBC2334
MDTLDSGRQDALYKHLFEEELALIWFLHLEFGEKHEWLKTNRKEFRDMRHYRLRGVVFQKIYHLCEKAWVVRKVFYRCEKYENGLDWFLLVLQDLIATSAINHFSSLTEAKRGNKVEKIKAFRPNKGKDGQSRGRDVCRSLQLGENPFLNKQLYPHFHLMIDTAIAFKARDFKKPKTPLQMAYAEYIAAYTEFIKDRTTGAGWCDIFIKDGKARLQSNRGSSNYILPSITPDLLTEKLVFWNAYAVRNSGVNNQNQIS